MGRSVTGQAAGRENMAPPGTSKCRVSTFTTSTIQLASVPNSWLQVPMRP